MQGCPIHNSPIRNLLDPDVYATGMPYSDLVALRRERGPVVWMEDPATGIPYWAVIGREELDYVAKNPALFSSAARSAWPVEFDESQMDTMVRVQLINMDPPLHQKHRRVLRQAFTPKAVDSYEPRFREHARRIVDAVARRGECEFVEEVAAELPLLAILELMGIPVEDRKQFFDWTNTMSFADDPDMAVSAEDGMAAATNMIAYGYELAAKHRRQPGNTIVDAMLQGEVDGKPLSEEEFGWTFLLLIVGGNESTRTVTAQGMRLLMENPDQLQYLLDNPDRIPQATEEMLRYNTAFITMRRTAMDDIELGGQNIKRGDKVVLHYHSVNLDERVFGDDALRFDVRRAERMPDLGNQHRAFGVGQHFCIGSHLARLELRVMFDEILPRLKNPRFAAPVRYFRSNFVNAVKEMRINFDPEA